MLVEPRAVETCICSCFYAELETDGVPNPSSIDAWKRWSAMYEPELGEEPEHVKMREDLSALGMARFTLGWDHLLSVYAAVEPGELHTWMRSTFGEKVRGGYQRRAARRGQA